MPNDGIDLPAHDADNSESPAPDSRAPESPSSAPDKSGADSTPWFGTEESHKTLVENKKWNGVADVLTSYAELERAFSSKTVPKAPAKAEDYKFTLPEDAESLGYDENFEKQFRSWLHSSGASQDVAAGLHGAYVNFAREQVAAANEAAKQEFEHTSLSVANELKKVWGDPQTPQFKRNLEMSERAIRNLSPGLKDALKSHGIIRDAEDGKGGTREMVMNAEIFKALAAVGNRMYAEDEVYGAAASSTNPFDPDTLDLAAQSQIFRTDKAKARSLILALPANKRGKYANMLSELR